MRYGFPARAGMDLGVHRHSAGSQRIPRTRGDGPPDCPTRRRHQPDSPHARGWTLGHAGGHPAWEGFPARAGMDRGRRGHRRAGRRIPRTRGDGPLVDLAARRLLADSPHARGWTSRPLRPGRAHCGFPARAGMDPARAPCSPTWRRIPRTRGDGPYPGPPVVSPAGDSPHARGWTSSWPTSPAPGTGFPARAGMDPWRRLARGPDGGIPRTRGDGPSAARIAPSAARDSPHARGWTVEGWMRMAAEAGFPARAGMDRRRGWWRITRPGIPRTRGDGPRPVPGSRSGLADSPHARGWTLLHLHAGRHPVGFPARAGMDPAPRIRYPVVARIPRTRGDGPPRGDSGPGHRGDSPHARGWTPGGRHGGLRSGGFPARAGMDPLRHMLGVYRARIPRTRGDGPGRRTLPRACCLDSPHARGWTRVPASPGASAAGFPARAGMDLFGRWCSQPYPGIPRTRGDGPWDSLVNAHLQPDSPHARGWTGPLARSVEIVTGFPARAGMDPILLIDRLGRVGIPRTRGDGPLLTLCLPLWYQDSPHARGWTRRGTHDDGHGRGFPARAGMDPRRAHCWRRPSWIPRTRGDGPAKPSSASERLEDSPHARGWTPSRSPRRPGCRGFPARAGMDRWRRPRGARGMGIPRTRGDGPTARARQASVRPDSPHARGWTPEAGQVSVPAPGFPARAGMDP